jgi:UDP-3-O-[3-hydroxymyristoyl] glucosamine N-acyltransferase
MKNSNFHQTSIVSDEAMIGQNVSIGPYSIIHSGTHIEENSQIGAYCEIGLPTPLANEKLLIIGKEANIRSHSIIYQGSNIGPRLTTGHHVTIREKSIIGSDFQLGSRGDVQGHCKIGDYVRCHGDVHIGQKTELGNYIWLFPNVLITNDPDPPSDNLVGVKIQDFAVIASNVLLLPGAEIGEFAVVAAGSVVNSTISKGLLAAGSPAKEKCKANILRMHNDPSQKAYPWIERFYRGYPEEIYNQWLKSNPKEKNK